MIGKVVSGAGGENLPALFVIIGRDGISGALRR